MPPIQPIMPKHPKKVACCVGVKLCQKSTAYVRSRRISALSQRDAYHMTTTASQNASWNAAR